MGARVSTLCLQGGGLLWVLLAPVPDSAEPKPLPALPSTPPPMGSALGCSLPPLHLAAVLYSSLPHPVARHAAKLLGAAGAGSTFPAPAISATESHAGGAGGGPARCPSLPPTSLCLLAGCAACQGRGAKQARGGRQTDRQTDGHQRLTSPPRVGAPAAACPGPAPCCPVPRLSWPACFTHR